MKRKDLTGKRFGRYTVVEYVGTKYDKNGGNAKARWKCQCDCGNIRIVDSASLLLGRSKSCGCLCREINSQRMKKMIKDNECYITRLREQLKLAESTLVVCALNRIYASINAKEYLDKYCSGWEKTT